MGRRRDGQAHGAVRQERARATDLQRAGEARVITRQVSRLRSRRARDVRVHNHGARADNRRRQGERRSIRTRYQERAIAIHRDGTTSRNDGSYPQQLERTCGDGGRPRVSVGI